MRPTQPILLAASVLGLAVVGCAHRGTPAAGSGSAGAASRSAFSITLHCEPGDSLANWEQQQRTALERERVYGSATAGPQVGLEDDCDQLIEAIREGSDALLSEARYDRVRIRQ